MSGGLYSTEGRGVGQVDQIVEVIYFIAAAIHDCHEMLKLRAGHLIQPGGEVVELIEVFVFAKEIADSMNGAVIILSLIHI